jgi:hypothetical protein
MANILKITGQEINNALRKRTRTEAPGITARSELIDRDRYYALRERGS